MSCINAQENGTELRQIEDIKRYSDKYFWIDLSEAEKESIRLGRENAKKGKLIPHSEAKKRYGKWL
jgi:predicted transcriptional regulator